MVHMAPNPRSATRKLKRPQLLYQIVQDEVKAYILEHGLVPGDALPPETELAEQLGVSRNSVREAIKSLETLGIVEAKTGAGLFVRNFSFDPLINNLAYGLMFDLRELADIYEVRYHIEQHMVDQVVDAATDAQVQQLYAILERMRTVIERNGDYLEEDRLFHRTLWANVPNRTVGKIIDVFWMVAVKARERSTIPPDADQMEVYRWHVDIVDALARRDLAATRHAMGRHYSHVQEHLQAMRVARAAEETARGQ